MSVSPSRLVSRGVAWALALLVIAWTASKADEQPGSIASLLLLAALASGALGRPRAIGGARSWISAPPWAVTASVAAAIALVGLFVFGPDVASGAAGRNGDWPFHDALIETLYASLEDGRGTPPWVLTVTTGDPTYELYPAFVYHLVARIALVLGSPGFIHPVMLWVALAAYVGVAIATARLALRFASAPAALAVGLATLLDLGAVFTWGARATWFWGLYPSSVSIALALWMMPSILDLVREHPTRARIATIWGTTTLAAFAHPVGIVFTSTLLACCVVLACFGSRGRRVRWGQAALHVGIGLALPAFHWMPEGRRLIEHGVHYGMGQIPLSLAWERASTGVLPETSYPALVLLGLAVPVVVLLVRDRSLAIFPFLAAWVLYASYLDPPFLLFAGAPTPATVRLQAPRVGTVSAPLIYAAAALLLALPGRVPRVRFVTTGYRAICAALAIAALWTYGEPLAAHLDAHVEGIRRDQLGVQRIRDRDSLDALIRFFRDESRELGPGRYARALFLHQPDAPNELLLIGTRAGVPIVARGDRVPAFFLREQFFDLGPENLRRHAFRWIVGEGSVSLGDPATERRFGGFVVREIEGWDGRIARVTRGEGEVRVTRFDGEGIELEVDAAEPVLVEIGTPYYGRWRAYHEGAAIEACAQPVTADRRAQRVLAAWLPPGRTVLRPDGALPSDRAGWPFTLAGIALAIFAWPHRSERMRRAIGPWMARALAWAPRVLAPWTFVLGAALVVAVFLVRQGATGGALRAVRYGGFFGAAQVMRIAPDGTRSACEQSDWLGHEHRCEDGTVVRHEVVMVIEDAPVSWDAPAPGIHVESPGPVELEIRTPGRFEGSYLGACTLCTATVALGEVERELRMNATGELEAEAPQRGAVVTLRARGPHAWFAVAERTALDGDRLHDVPFCDAD